MRRMSMATVKLNFRQTDKECTRMRKAMRTIGMENESEFIRDSLRRRCEQIEGPKRKKPK
jgi:hypothetical protein